MRWRQLVTAFGLLLISWSLICSTLSALTRNDPDRYYHFAISRAYTPRMTVPQAEDVGWGTRFPEKEFLFHELTAKAYRLAGDDGVERAVQGMGWLVLCLLVWLASSFVGPWNAVALVLACAISSPLFSMRLALVRPHVLAIFFFTLLLGGLLKKKPWLSFLAGAGYLLGYHAFYVPLTVIAVAALDRSRLKAAAGGLLGCCAGLLVNPYFPLNFWAGVQHLQIALGHGGIPVAKEGAELASFSFVAALATFLFPILLVGLGWRRLRTTRERSSDHLFLLLAASIFWILAFKSPRALEYGYPLAALLAASTVARSARAQYKQVLALSLIAICLQAGVWKRILLFGQGLNVDGRVTEMRDALERIPMGRSQKVFNCTWDLSPYIYYYRPDLRFVDLLDPSYLYLYSREKYDLREALMAEKVSDPRAALEVFGADYVLCSDETFVKLLEAQPSFKASYQSSHVSLIKVQRGLPHQGLAPR